MNHNQQFTLFHIPGSRSTGVQILLEELGAAYTLKVLDFSAKEQREPDYLAVNPMGKVPALLHGDALITEQAAIFIYLADLFPETGLAPPIGDALRGPWLRWMVYYGSSFEPAVVDRALKRKPAPPSFCPYGDFDTMFGTLTAHLAQGPWMLGERYSAADPLWGNAFRWMTANRVLPNVPVIENYLERLNARPAVQRVQAKNAELLAAQNKSGGSKGQ